MLKLLDFRTEDEALGGADSLDGGHNFVADESEFAGQVEQGDGLERVLRHRGLSYRERAAQWRNLVGMRQMTAGVSSNRRAGSSNGLLVRFIGCRVSLYPRQKLVRVDCCNSAELYVFRRVLNRRTR